MKSGSQLQIAEAAKKMVKLKTVCQGYFARIFGFKRMLFKGEVKIYFESPFSWYSLSELMAQMSSLEPVFFSKISTALNAVNIEWS